MDKQQLMPGEEILIQSDDLTITLTNFRIRYYETQMGHARLTSMHLDKLSAIEMTYISYLFLLYAGILIFISGLLIGVTGDAPEISGAIAGPGVFLIIVYLLSRKHIVSISSDSGIKINFQTKGMTTDKHLHFINKIETAKNNLLQNQVKG